MLATKASLSVRVDALADEEAKSDPQAPSIGIEYRAKLESRLRALEYRSDLNPGPGQRKGGFGRKQAKFELSNGPSVGTYNTAADSVDLPTNMDPAQTAADAVADVKEERQRRKEEKRAAKEAKRAKKAEKEASKATEPEEMEVDGVQADEDNDEKAERKRLKKLEKKAAKETAAAAAVATDSQQPSANGTEADKPSKKRRADGDERSTKKKKKSE